tara:strand:+ start:334 stop:522 length:189 start_codon:yes stop_codon:yes gene_type:complete
LNAGIETAVIDAVEATIGASVLETSTGFEVDTEVALEEAIEAGVDEAGIDPDNLSDEQIEMV